MKKVRGERQKSGVGALHLERKRALAPATSAESQLRAIREHLPGKDESGNHRGRAEFQMADYNDSAGELGQVNFSFIRSLAG